MNYYIGIDLGGTNITAGVVDENYQIIAKLNTETHPKRSFEEIVSNIGKIAYEVVEKANLTMDDITSVGMGSPSCINPKTGLLVHSNNTNWKNVPLYEEMKKHIAKPVYIKNDADCAALGEVLIGSAKEYKDALMITLGTGVGGGIIIDKKIFSGCDNMGAELGHTILVYDGIQCTCGRYGCFESYASATALIKQAKEAINKYPDSLLAEICKDDLSSINGRTAFDAADKGDPVAKKVVDQYISYVAAGISSIITIFRPEIIIIGGGISNQGNSLITPLNKKIEKYTFSSELIGVPKAVVASLGNDAGIIGAAMIELSLKI